MKKKYYFLLPIIFLQIVLLIIVIRKYSAYQEEKTLLITTKISGIYDSHKNVGKGNVMIFLRKDSQLVDIFLMGFLQYMDQLQKDDSVYKPAQSGIIEIYRKDERGRYYHSSDLPPIK